jgi:UDP-glucose 4-epimerase
MNILITGGAGFIGSHLADHLIDLGHSVWTVDDLSTGAVENIAHLKSHPRFHYVIDSIMNVPVLAELVDQADLIFHAAAAVGVRLIVESPVRTIETNIRGTEIVLQAAGKKRKPVVIFSTSEVYGKSDQIPFSEDSDLVLGPTYKGRWSYACSKAVDEFLALAYWHEKKLPVIVVRLFNTVGPRQTGRYGMVLPTFIVQALRGDPVTVFGDGSQSRCFSYVSDVVGALAGLMIRSEAYGEVFNIGNAEEVTILELARRVIRQLNSKSPIKFVPYDEAYEAGFEDMPRRVPDLRKIGRLIGYRPKVGLDEMILRTAEYYRPRVAASQDRAVSFRVESELP